MRMSDWSSDVCSSDLTAQASGHRSQESLPAAQARGSTCRIAWQSPDRELPLEEEESESLHPHEARHQIRWDHCRRPAGNGQNGWRYLRDRTRSEEHTSELQSLMRISYAVFCLKKKKATNR